MDKDKIFKAASALIPVVLMVIRQLTALIKAMKEEGYEPPDLQELKDVTEELRNLEELK